MTGFFLRLYRIPAILLWSILLGVGCVPYRLGGRWSDIKKLSYFARTWNGGLAKIVNLRVKVYGRIPDGYGGMVVSNHLSYMDIVTHAAILPLRFMPKSDIAKWPLIGWYLGLSLPIWTNRESKQASKKTLRDIVKTMKRGICMVVYPEGTSTDGKSGILPFKSTAFEAAIIGNAPITPVLTRYIQPPGQPTVCWYGDMTLLPHLWQILGLPSIEAELRFLDPIYPSGMSRKELASMVREKMASEYAAI